MNRNKKVFSKLMDNMKTGQLYNKTYSLKFIEEELNSLKIEQKVLENERQSFQYQKKS